MFHVTHREPFYSEIGWSCSPFQWIVFIEMKKRSNWVGNFTMSRLQLFRPLINPCVHPHHCKRDVCQQPYSSAMSELEAKQWQLWMGRHLCSYKASFLFLHLNIVVGKQAMLAKNTQEIQHLFSDGKRLTVFAFLPSATLSYPHLSFNLTNLLCKGLPFCIILLGPWW